MSGFSDQLEEIKSLISSAATKANKSFAYSTLLHLQQQSSDCHDLIQMLARSSRSLIRPTVADVRNNDEEIATQALKCLGFMIYHPSIVAEIAADDVKFVLDSLAKLITTTKMKSVCNLGVWCISIQQLSTPLLAAHFHSLLLAIVHAIDNPIGSLSTTFEAIQLATLLSENMREMSHIWAPPVYRRLLSSHKREGYVRELFENAQRWSYHCGFYNSSMPYLSLLHGKLTEEERKKTGEIVNILDESITSLTFPVTHFALYEIDYDDKSLKSWTKIAEIGR
ncbi:hypothetical protein PS2_043118 [Malus domestica]